MSKQHKPGPASHSSAEQMRTITGKVKVEGGIEVHFPPDVEQQAAAANEKKESREAVKQYVESVTLFFVILVAGLNGCQTYSNQRMVTVATEQANLLRTQIILDERPYVEPIADFEFSTFANPPSKIAEPIIGQPIVVNIRYGNQGRSAALCLFVVRYLEFGPKAYDLFKERRSVPNEPCRSTMLPGQNPRTTTAYTRKDDFSVQSAGVDPANVVLWHGEQPILLFANFFYKDAFGSTYCTQIADRYLGHGSWLRVDEADSGAPCEDHPNTQVQVK